MFLSISCLPREYETERLRQYSPYSITKCYICTVMPRASANLTKERVAKARPGHLVDCNWLYVLVKTRHDVRESDRNDNNDKKNELILSVDMINQQGNNDEINRFDYRHAASSYYQFKCHATCR